MANFSIENEYSTSDKLIIIVAMVFVLTGVVGFCLCNKWTFPIRVLILAVSLLSSFAIATLSKIFKIFTIFTKDSCREMRKMIWPSWKETNQTTLIVFAFVFMMAIYLWLSDKIIEWGIFSLILKWR